MHYYFIGIGGIGMSALAHILLDQGIAVSGTDRVFSSIVEALVKKGAKISSENNALDPTVTRVVYTTAVLPEHPILLEANKKNISIIHRSRLLKELMIGQKGLLVAGTHGKTTTSSLLAHVLCHIGMEPSFAVGGIVKSLIANGGFGRGEYFVAEADESDGSFNILDPWGGIVTNIDNDHLDYWKTTSTLLDGFKKYLLSHQSTDHLLWCIDDENLAMLNPVGISYGFSEDAALRVLSFNQEGWFNSFDILFQGKNYSNIKIPLIGGHNVLNASAVFGLCLQLGVEETLIREAFVTFEGVERRAEKKGEYEGIPFYDDYAHHPTEITATLRAMKKACGDKRLIVAFQPHRFTRTRDCMNDFTEAFHSADVVVLTEIYGAGESEIEGVNSEALFSLMQKSSKESIFYCPRKKLALFLEGLMRPNDVIVTMGAGDITKLSKEILTKTDQ